jgi:hypothetical protein
MRPADVVRAALDRDELEVCDEPGQPRVCRLVGQDAVFGAVDDQRRRVDLRQVAMEVRQPRVDARVGGVRRRAGGDLEACLPGLLADALGASLSTLEKLSRKSLKYA